jgi:hypothetical protein
MKKLLLVMIAVISLFGCFVKEEAKKEETKKEKYISPPQIPPIEKEMASWAEGRWEKWRVFYEKSVNLVNFRIWIHWDANQTAMDSYVKIVEDLMGTYASDQDVSVILYKGSTPVRRYSRKSTYSLLSS